MIVVLERPEEEVGGVGGPEGMKMEGIQVIVAIMDTIRTTWGIEPRNGLISCASWDMC